MSTYNYQVDNIPPQPPKKALCAFFRYRIDVYDLIRNQHPEFKITDFTRIIGDMWKALDPKLKQRYQMEYELNRQKVSEQRNKYQKTYGRRARSRKSKKVKRAMNYLKNHFR